MTYEEAVAVIPAGIYSHFKGNYYKVLYIARHSETNEPIVVYRALYGDRGVWIRPADMWNEIFDELSAAAREEIKLTDEMKNKLLLLEEYYTSGEWQADYEADEADLFPADLKRGILSQDGVSDLLELLQPGI